MDPLKVAKFAKLVGVALITTSGYIIKKYGPIVFDKCIKIFPKK